MEWIKVSQRVYQGLLVKEIKCPICGYKQTFTDKPKELICYICRTRSDYKEDES